MSGFWWGWFALFLLGAYHGINPGMGWLFAVALGLQENSKRAVIRSLAPIALGHAIAIGGVLLVAGLVQIVLPLSAVRVAVAGALVGLGAYRIVRSRHSVRGGGMRVGFRDLTIWSFLMASAHGAGLMVLPVVMGIPAVMLPWGILRMRINFRISGRACGPRSSIPPDILHLPRRSLWWFTASWGWRSCGGPGSISIWSGPWH